MFKLRYGYLISGIITGCILLVSFITTLPDGKLHLFFCDVGQGDAAYIKFPDGKDMLVDGGPDDKVILCLSRHMPFWDRDLELVILTHPHLDHFMGLFSVFKNYKVISFATENLQNKSVGFNAFTDLVKSQKTKSRFVLAGDRFILKDGVEFEIVGPKEEFLNVTSPQGFIGESGEFASVETLIQYGKFSALLTGDSQASELEEILKQVQYDTPLSVLQVPHHGSHTGLTAEILNILNPKLAVISVGAKNKYGHPNPETLKILGYKDIKILRTDQDGEVEIISDGKSFKIKSI